MCNVISGENDEIRVIARFLTLTFLRIVLKAGLFSYFVNCALFILAHSGAIIVTLLHIIHARPYIPANEID